MHPRLLNAPAGRVHAISVVKLVGALLLVYMGSVPSIWADKPLVVAIYLLRTSANNSTYALQKSILMDFVPKVPSAPCSDLAPPHTFGLAHLDLPCACLHLHLGLVAAAVVRWLRSTYLH